MKQLQRLWPLRTYAVDLVIVGLGVAALFELLDARDSLNIHAPYRAEVWHIVVASFGITLPLLLRRRFPFAAPLVSMLIALAVSFLDGRIVTYSGFLLGAGLAVSAVFGFISNRRLAAVGLVVLFASTAILEANEPRGSWGDVPFLWILFCIFWTVGFAVKQQSVKVEQAHRRAESAVADERARIARELHDVVGHAVSVMTVQTAAVRRLLREDQVREREALLTVEQTGRQALAEMRRMVGVLKHPEEAPARAPQPSLEYLDKLVEQTRVAGLPVELRVEGTPIELPASVDLTAYRLVQEGLTNALKHANASRAEVVVKYDNNAVELVVSDDGRGPALAAAGGQGLVGMRERVSVYGGEIEAGPKPGGGYRLRAKLPVEAA